MKPGEMQYCPFCGSAGLDPDPTSAPGPETYYDCPECGRIGTTGVGYRPTGASK